MTWTRTVGEGMNLVRLREYIQSLDFSVWRPSLIVWHNTAAPTLAQWMKSEESDKAAGKVPGETRIHNLEVYFRDQNGWPSGPHAFVSEDLVWPFTPFNKKGTHSPSWNGTAIGIEMVGDFDKEAFNSGPGLLVRQNTVALTAMLCEKLGLDPTTCIRIHKEDPRTTHDCPGANASKAKLQMIDEVLAYMGHAGNHTDTDVGHALDGSQKGLWSGLVDADSLNLREASSASGKILAALPRGLKLTIANDAMNGTTRWLYVEPASTTIKGWVSAKFVKESGK